MDVIKSILTPKGLAGKGLNNPSIKSYFILLLLILSAFANSAGNSFVWDDYMTIVNNPNIDIPYKEIPSIFSEGFLKNSGETASRQVYYRPLLSLYYILNHKIWGLNPVGFHLSNLFLYALTAIFLYRAGLILFSGHKDSRLIALIGSSVFAVHPVNSAVAGRAASGEILLGFFIMLSLYFFLAGRRILSLSMFTLALLSKETALMLPFALVILSSDRTSIKKGLLPIVPYLALTAAYLILRIAFTDTVFGDRIEVPAFTRLLTMSAATLDYIKLLIIPYPLSLHYPARWHTSISDPKVIIAIAVLISVIIIMYRQRKDRTMLFLSLSPLILLAPVIWRVNTFSVGQESEYIAERFLHAPSLFYSLLAAAYSIRVAGGRSEKRLAAAWTVIIMLFAVATLSNNRIWKDDVVFFNEVIRTSPDTAFAHNNLGVAYGRQRHFEKAVNEYLAALKIKPDYAEAHNNLGNVYEKQGHLDRAVDEYLTALMLKPDYAEAHNNLGNAYEKQGHLDRAVNEYLTALMLKPDYAEAHNNMGYIHKRKGQIDKAVNEYLTALKVRPYFAEARYNLGNAYEMQGNIDGAVAEYLAALKIRPDYAEAHNNLGVCYAKTGRFPQASKEFMEALRYNPLYMNAQRNLEILNEKMNRQ